MPSDDVESALEDMALGRVEDKVTRMERRDDGTGADVKVSTVSKSSRPPSLKAIEALMARRVGGPQDWC